MHVLIREIHNISARLLREYLEELGGRVTADDCICGEGWQARLTQMKDSVTGALSVEQMRLEWRGDEQAFQCIWPLLEQKIMRAAG